MSILRLFEGPTPLLTTREVLARSSLPKTTTLRLLQMLRTEGLLCSTGDGYLGPGPSLLALARTVHDYWQVSSATEDVVRGLGEEAGETASIFVISDLSRMCVCRAEASSAIRHVVSVGERLPLSSGATSFVLLSDKDGELVDRVLAAAPPGYPSGELLGQIRKARESGYAISHGTREPGLSAVAAPVVFEDQVRAALSVSGPSSRFTHSALARLIELTREAAAQLSEASRVDPVFRSHRGAGS